MKYEIFKKVEDLIEWVNDMKEQYKTNIEIIEITQAINSYTLFYEVKK